MDAISVVAVFGGGIAAFFGYRLITDAIRVWGFMIGAALAAYLVTAIFKLPGSFNNITLPFAIALLVGGALGAVAAGPLEIVIIFFSGAALGVAVGSIAVPIIMRGPEIMLLTVGLALLTGLLAVRFQEVVLITTTSFLGALLIVYGVRNLSNIEVIPQVIIYFLVALFGAAAQYKTEHPDISLLGR